MIIKKLLDFCLNLFTNLLSGVEGIPDLPPELLSIIRTALDFIIAGIDILAMLIGKQAVTFMGICLDIIIAANLFYFGYTVVMWFVKKIPFLGIK